MLLRLQILLTLCLFSGIAAFGQAGSLSGQVKDADGPIGYAPVYLEQGSVVRNAVQTDINGQYSMQGIDPGIYDVHITYLEVDTLISGVQIVGGKTEFLNIDLTVKSTISTGIVEIVDYKVPVYNKDQRTTGLTMTNQDVKNMGTRNVNSLASITPGVYQSDEGSGSLSIRGARDNSNVYIVDGQKIRGVPNLPQNAIQEFQVITGGAPAEFGDFTGGVINITTASPRPKFSGGVEAVTSQFLDPYGRNLLGITLSGPLIKDSVFIELQDGSKAGYERAVLGYFIGGEFEYQQDQDPAARGIYQLRDGLLSDLENTPLEIAEDRLSFRSRANFLRADDLEQINAKVFNEDLRVRANARIDFEPVEDLIIKAGGSVERIWSDSWGITNSLFSPEDGNQVFRGGLYRGWLRFQQQFKADDPSASVLKSLLYSVQGDYSLYQRNFQHRRHGTNFFDYGYIGQFNYDRVPFYTYTDDPNSAVSSSPYWQTAAYGTANLTFDPTNTRNQTYANYNNVIFDYVENTGIENPNPFSANRTLFNVGDFNNLLFFQGLRNGDAPSSIYSTFTGIGQQASSYTKFNFEQYRLTGQVTAELGAKGKDETEDKKSRHYIKAGFEFEQRVERRYDIFARGLWNRMRQLTNFHLNTLSDDISTYEYSGVDFNQTSTGEFTDTVSIPIQYVGEDQANFDLNLRNKLGLPVDGVDWINIDALSPDFYTLDMFSADELLDEGIGPVNYYGYDYKGNKADNVDDALFFTDTDNRPMNAFSPTYIAAYIQDRFELEDILFNIGVRVDRFDANQPVLRDVYSLYPTFTAGEAASQLGINLPANVQSDWMPYVDDETNPSEVVGYRTGDEWFDATGAPTSSTAIAAASGGKAKPFIKESEVSINSFEDYTPQTVIMPRISFSFPITDQSLFFAHYDVLSQRPGQLLAFQGSLLAGRLADYAFLENTPTISVSNPNLLPEVTIDYEAGFKQQLSDNMGLSISAFYREQRNMIQTRIFNDAYPFSYTTYDNVDFGTIKGFSFQYDLRRTRKFPITLRASYTLQFATATGSSFSSGRNVAQFLEGTGLLRVLLPINTDQRHRITANFDFRFDPSIGLKGPGFNWGKKDEEGNRKKVHPLQGVGANFTAIFGSGTPYSVNTIPTPAGQFGVVTNTQLAGTPNGSRLPGTFRVDLKLDKNFSFGGKEKDDGTSTRRYDVTVYLEVLNLLNTENILGVYRYTGLPDDDGYLSSDIGQQVISAQIDPESFVDLYTVKINNPNFYSVPRRARIGLFFNF